MVHLFHQVDVLGAPGAVLRPMYEQMSQRERRRLRSFVCMARRSSDGLARHVKLRLDRHEARVAASRIDRVPEPIAGSSHAR